MVFLRDMDVNKWSAVKRYIIRNFNVFDIYSIISIRNKGPLYEDGWFKSFREQASVDANGDPLPWFTYPAIEFINRRVKSWMSVFEYGCGGSTLWWAKRVKEVISVEHDKEWCKKMVANIPSNVKLHHIDLVYDGAYSKMIKESDIKFDVVVIDGRDRVNCIKYCLDSLDDRGVIILDNSNRKEYLEGISYLIKNNFKKIDFVGLCPIVNYKSETSIFYRSCNSFDI